MLKLVNISVKQENQDKVECANESLRADLERWQYEKKNDLKKLFVALANQQIRYYEQVCTQPQSELSDMRD